MELFIEGLWSHAKKETTLILVNFEKHFLLGSYAPSRILYRAKQLLDLDISNYIWYIGAKLEWFHS